MVEKNASLVGKAALGLGAAAVGTSLYRGMVDDDANAARQRELIAQRKVDLSTPMYNPVNRKHAAAPPPPLSFGERLQGGAEKALAAGAGHAIGHMLSIPANYALEQMKKRFIQGPKHEAAFTAAIQSDPDLQRTFAENPGLLHSSHETLKKFAPTVATDPNAVRSFLVHAAATRGAIDFATLKQLAETEKLHRFPQGK